MTTVISAILSLLLIAAGYAYVCHYLKGLPWNERSVSVLELTPGKLAYCVAAVITAAVLIALFELLYQLPLLQQLKLLFLVMTLFPAAAIDRKTQKIPNKLLLASLVLRCILLAAEVAVSPAKGLAAAKNGLLGAVVIGVFFLLLLLIFKNSIGMGDVKLFALMGLYQGLWGVINSVFFSLVVSLFAAIILLIAKKKGRKDTMSFGPSILVGTVIAMAVAGM